VLTTHGTYGKEIAPWKNMIPADNEIEAMKRHLDLISCLGWYYREVSQQEPGNFE